MLAALIEAAVRPLIVASMVWAALRIFRIRNVESQRCAWTAVLIGSLLMPFALFVTSRWHVLSLATIPAPETLDRLRAASTPMTANGMPAVLTHATMATSVSRHSIVTPKHDRLGPPQKPLATNGDNRVEAKPPNLISSPARDTSPARSAPLGIKLSPAVIAVLVYFAVAGALLVRLLLGLVSALRLWHSSAPAAPCRATLLGADFELRMSREIPAPVTIGSGVVLPAGYTSWPEEKLRVVLAHERSHVVLHDFHLQILASLYAALTWFSPLGWWLKHKLSDLGEAISDRSGLDAASNRSAYAQVLLEFAAAPRPTLIGVAMARNSSISRRIERLLNDSYLRHAFSGGTRARIAFLVVPAVLFAAAALVRVEAASHAGNEPSAAPQIAQAQASLSAAQAQMLAARQASAAQEQAQRHAEAAQALSKAQAALVAAQTQLQAEQQGKLAGTEQMLAEAQAALEAAQALPALPTGAAPLLPREIATGTPPDPPEPPAAGRGDETGAEATFDRNLTFSGTLDLSVSTGSGNITFKRGSASQIHIHGIVKGNHDADPAQVQQLAANPPITQEGNSIRIGGQHQNLHNISISYEIEAPADATLNAATGSGNINDTGVGHDAKLTTGSGNIVATGIEGGFKTQTGSGNIAIEGGGQGEAKAQTGSGDIELKGVNGALDAQTGSGTIKAAGTPAAPWKLEAGSGSIELVTGNAPMNLDASTGSGKISTNLSVATENPEDHHHMRAQLNGGGPDVRVETGSGDIRVD